MRCIYSGQRQPIMLRASRLHSWDVFAYELLSNQLRALRLLLGQFSSGQRQPIMRRASRLHSWDVFAYEPLPNRLRPSDLALGRLSKETNRRRSGATSRICRRREASADV